MHKLIAGAMVALLLTGCGSSGKESTAPAPAVPQPASQPPAAKPEPPKPAVNFQQPAAQVKGNAATLQQALGEKSAVTYVINVQTGKPAKDKTEILDDILAAQKLPGKNDLVLVIFQEDNDIRFAMGALFFEKKVTVNEMLNLVRTHYLSKAREGDPAAGLADLIRAVNQRIGG